MTLRLLLNENIPMPSIRSLREAGFDVTAVAEFEPGIADVEVLARAREEQRWIVTFDRDYGELVFSRGLVPPPAVILFRVSSYGPLDPARWLIELAALEGDLVGRFTVFDGTSIRSRPLLHPA